MNTRTTNQPPANFQPARFPLRKFLTLCIPVAVVIFATAFAFTDMRFKEQLAQLVVIERIQLRQLGSYVASDVSTALVQLQTLAGENGIRNAMDSPYPGALQALESEFVTLARRNPIYQQIRWIDEDGAERVRVTREGRRVSAAGAGQLRDTGSQYYFKTARSLPIGELYISHLDPAGENGDIELSGRPTLRVATPLQDSYSRRRGILILDMTMQHMTDALRSANEVGQSSDYSLINKEGDWLTESGQEHQTGSRPEPGSRFPEQHPGAWQRMGASYAGYAELDDGFWIWDKLETDEDIRRAFAADSDNGDEMPSINSSAFSPLLVAHKPPGALAELRHEIFMMVMLGAALFMGVYVWSLLFLLRGQVREKRADLEVVYATARAEQMERVHEMEKRFRLLVEASGVGMVVVNSEGTILMSNSTAEAMLGYSKGGLKGQSVDSLLPPEQRARHAGIRTEYLRNPEVRKMGAGRKLEALTADGRRIPVEVGLNPYLDHGKQVVLASIIDLSSSQGHRADSELQPG